jgi:hypothetical protein
MSVSFIVAKLEQLVNETEAFLKDIEKEMEVLDMESKAYADLDFEYNYTSGMLIAYRHSLRIAQTGE